MIFRRRLYVEKDGRVVIYRPRTNRLLFARLRAYSYPRMRVLIKYLDEKKEYKVKPFNDSGWYSNKKELLQTAKAFCEI